MATVITAFREIETCLLHGLITRNCSQQAVSYYSTVGRVAQSV